MEDVRLVIRKERIAQGISQSGLAEMIGVSDRCIVYWESGARGITVENADRALKALGIRFVIGDSN